MLKSAKGKRQKKTFCYFEFKQLIQINQQIIYI